MKLLSRDEFRQSVAKYVRPNHVQSTHGWMYQKIEKNEICKN